MKVTKFRTLYKVEYDEGEEERVQPLINSMTTIDLMTEQPVKLGYFQKGRVIHVPSGISEASMKRMLKITYIENKYDACMNKLDLCKIKYRMKHTPHNEEQKKVVKYATEELRKTGKVIIDLFTGTGKTFSSIYTTVNNLKVKPICFVYSTDLKEQWTKAFYKHSEAKNIFYSEGPKSLINLLDSSVEYEAFVVTHRTILLFVQEYGYGKLNKIFLRHGIGCKIFDEYDTEVRNMFRIDCHTDIPYTMYLSATTNKSSFNDDLVFQRCFEDIAKFGKSVYENYVPKRKMDAIVYDSKPSNKEKRNCYSWDGKFFMPDNYHNYLMVKNTHHARVIKEVLDKEKEYSKNPGYRMAFFVGKIDACDITVEILEKEFGVKRNEIGIINSTVKATNRIFAMKKAKYIVTTQKSFGRGIDVSDLDAVCNLEVNPTDPKWLQMIGRVGRYGGKIGRVYDSYNIGFVKIQEILKNRKPQFLRKDNFEEYKITKIDA